MRRDRKTVEDELLVIAAKRGDAEALDALIRRWQERLLGFIASLCGDRGLAEDLLQETCLGIARGIRKLKDPAAFPKWSFTLASRRYADHVRREVRRREAYSDLRDEVDRAAVAAGSSELEIRLSEALDSLSSGDRQLLCQAYIEEIPQHELGTMLGIPLGTIKSRLFHARRKLKRRFLNRKKP